MYRFGKADKVVPVTDGNGYKVMVYTTMSMLRDVLEIITTEENSPSVG